MRGVSIKISWEDHPLPKYKLFFGFRDLRLMMIAISDAIILNELHCNDKDKTGRLQAKARVMEFRKLREKILKRWGVKSKILIAEFRRKLFDDVYSKCKRPKK